LLFVPWQKILGKRRKRMKMTMTTKNDSIDWYWGTPTFYFLCSFHWLTNGLSDLHNNMCYVCNFMMYENLSNFWWTHLFLLSIKNSIDNYWPWLLLFWEFNLTMNDLF
jgi:hypothetical protein